MAESAATNLVELAVDLVSAYVGNNAIPGSELSKLLVEVHSALVQIGGQGSQTREKPQRPPAAARRSASDEHLVCLEDGKHFKSLRRHLSAEHKMSPEQYREKWNLPADYPMVARHAARQGIEPAKKSRRRTRPKAPGAENGAAVKSANGRQKAVSPAPPHRERVFAEIYR